MIKTKPVKAPRGIQKNAAPPGENLRPSIEEPTETAPSPCGPSVAEWTKGTEQDIAERLAKLFGLTIIIPGVAQPTPALIAEVLPRVDYTPQPLVTGDELAGAIADMYNERQKHRAIGLQPHLVTASYEPPEMPDPGTPVAGLLRDADLEIVYDLSDAQLF